MVLLRRRLKLDVLKPSTDWCWPDGPREVRLPGATLDALARALALGGSGALLVYRGRGFVLRWEDGPFGAEDGAGPRGGDQPGAELAPADAATAATGPDGHEDPRSDGHGHGDSGFDGEGVVVPVRRYHLTSRYRNRAIRQIDDEADPPGPFVELVALPPGASGADGADVDGANMRDAIWWLLSRAGAALDEID